MAEQSVTVPFDRIYGALIGQAVGDALGAPTEGMTREGIVSRYGWVDDFVRDDPAGTDDTEYAILTARTLLRFGRELTVADVSTVWREALVRQEGGFFGGGFSEMTAINNLRDGLDGPYSGTDNHEMWSDGAAMRIAPVGAYCAGNPAEAARLAAIDAQVSHARDGIFCAQALAAGVAVAVTSSSWEAVIEAALAAVPADSWTARNVERAVGIGRAAPDARSALDELYQEISIFHYPWADVGPEATALAFGVFAAGKGEYVDTVLGGVNIGRDADTIAAMGGALAGALGGAEAIPIRWRERINQVRGHCIKAVAGTDIEDLARELHQVVAR